MTIIESIHAYTIEAANHGKKSTSWRSFAREISDRWGADTDLQEVAEESIPAWIEDMVARENAFSTITNKVGFLNTLLRFVGRKLSPATRQLALDVAKKQLRPNFQGPRVLSDKELATLKWAMSAGDFEIVTLAMKTGMTAQELFTVRIVDLNFTTGLIKVHKPGGEAREIPMVKDVRRILSKAAKTQKSRKAYAITPYGYSQWTNRRSMAENWKSFRFRPALQEAKIESFTWRDFRAMAATKMAEAGVPRQVIAEIFGYNSCRQVERYVNPHHKLQARALGVL